MSFLSCRLLFVLHDVDGNLSDQEQILEHAEEDLSNVILAKSLKFACFIFRRIHFKRTFGLFS
jgi:hypothetical protein